MRAALCNAFFRPATASSSGAARMRLSAQRAISYRGCEPMNEIPRASGLAKASVRAPDFKVT